MNKTTLIGCAHLMRLHRPIGTLLLLWPTLWALWIAGEGRPDASLVLIFIAGVFLMRSAGCVINDVADRNFDGMVTRTKARPLVLGVVSVRTALSLFALLAAISLLLLWSLNTLTRVLAVFALLLAVSYPFMKRWTHLPQLMLGLAFSWGIPMAFAAQTDTVPVYAWLLFLIAGVWTVAYDTMYAMVDKEDDRHAGIKSTAILFGDRSGMVIASLHVSMILLLVALGFYLEMGTIYYLVLACVVGVMFYLQALVRRADTASLFKAFNQSHWVGGVVFMAIFLDHVVYAS